MNSEFERNNRYAVEQEAYEKQMRGKPREPRQAYTYNDRGEVVPIERSRAFDKDEKPTRGPSAKPLQASTEGLEQPKPKAKRQMIDIDENNDTLPNVDAFSKAIERAKRLKGKMEEAIGDNAWEKLHGPHEVPKKYVPPFLRNDERPADRKADQMDQLYELEIDEAIRFDAQGKQTLPGAQSTIGKTGGDIMDMNQEEQIRFAGRGGNIKEMRFIRLKIKSMIIDDNQLLQKLVGNKFALTVALPLADVYKNQVTDQFIKLTNPTEVAANEFEFSSLSLYNFRLNEETFHELSSSFLQVMIDDQGVHGQMPMSKLLMADNFQLTCRIPLIKTVVIDQVKKKTEVKKGAKRDPKKEQQEVQKKESNAGTIIIDINLQRGDTEEELERNYQLKLMQQKEMQKREEELKILEKRKRAMMLLEEQPTFAQLYLHIERVGKGGIFMDRNGYEISNAKVISEKEQADSQRKLVEESEQEVKDDESTVDPQWPKRNLYVSYKSFPTFEKLMSSVIWASAEPNFNYRSQFPVLMTPDVIDRLEKFTFVIEVWDQVSPDRNDLVGLVKIPLAGFCYSLRTTEDDIFSLNFLAEKHNMYPMVVTDELLPIYSPKHGKNIGTLKVMLGLGTPTQVNRQIQREDELDRARENARLAKQQTQMQKKLMQNFTSGSVNNRDCTHEDEFRKIIEEENKRRDDLLVKKEEEERTNKFANALRQSLQMSGKKDFDIRQSGYLSAMRKLYEEFRTAGELGEINCEQMFSSDVRNHDGTVHQDEFVYKILNTEQLTLTRTEAFYIVDIMSNIVQHKERPNIDIDELQHGLTAYQKYNDLIEKRILDLLEKFKLAISKRVETDEDVFDLIGAIENRAVDSKMMLDDFRHEMEKRGIQIRDAIYDQFACFFDLDHSGTVYVASFCNYLRDPVSGGFNFFKLNPSLLQTHINEYVKNCLQSRPENLELLEREIKKELLKTKAEREKLTKPEDQPNLEEIQPSKQDETALDLLLNERINAKLFQVKLKRVGIVLSLWEVFSIFDYLNTQMAKVFYEPQRYHHVLYEHFYLMVTGEDYRRNIEAEMEKLKKEAEIAAQQVIEQAKKETQEKIQKRRRKRSHGNAKDDALDLAESLNLDKVGRDHSSDSDLLDSERSAVDDDRDLTASQLARKRKRQKARDEGRAYQQVKHTFDINIKELKNIPILTRFIREAKDFDNASLNRKKPLDESHASDDMVKKEEGDKNYIQNISVKYSFPLDEDEILESDYIRKIAPGGKDSKGNDVDPGNCYDYSVSMNTIHTYLLSKQDSIQTHLHGQQKMITSQQTTQLFNISLALYQDQREFIIGNAQLPLEDLVDLVNDFNNETNQFVASQEKAVLKRVLFLYGTSYSQRENCIIGKVVVEIAYNSVKMFLTAQEEKALKKSKRNPDESQSSCFMHRETFINRKIPLNALLSVFVDRVTNLKESIENIEHFAKINHNTFRVESDEDSLKQAQPEHQIDRRRILTQILKNGLNLVVLTSVFDEDEDLKMRFTDSQQQTRMLYNSLNPVFCENYQMQIQMDTKIFDYLKSKRAVFEVRHHILPGSKRTNDFVQSASSDGDQRCDYITLGYVRVPLLHLITKNNGIDGDFVILDDYKQKMGALKLRIALNHHNSQRPLFSGSTRLPTQVPIHDQAPSLTSPDAKELRTATLIDRSVVMNAARADKTTDLERTYAPNQEKCTYFLAMNFVELILQDRPQLLEVMNQMDQRSLSTLLFLKFKFLGNTYQTQFVSLDESSYVQKGQSMQSGFMKAINMATFDICKTVFLPVDLNDQAMVEKAFACPMEVQLWHRITSQRPYRQPDEEKLLGSFFVELNELPRVQNTRVKGAQQEKFICHEGYYTLHDTKKEGLSKDRLALKLFLIHNDNAQTLEELDLLFHCNSRREIEQQIVNTLDPYAKGYVELDDLTQLIEERELDKRAAHKMVCMVNDHLEYKNSDSVFYSPLFSLPPPYFKFAKKFDNFGIIERFMKELTSLDSHQQGFVPLALFRSVLEHELRIKVEIVDDFVAVCKNPSKTLDVNVLANSFQSHLDFIVLIRKLVKIIEVQDKRTQLAQTLSEAPSHDRTQRLVLSIDVESAMRLKNPEDEKEPPNCFVKFSAPKLKGMVGDQSFETDVVKESCYPAWHSRNHRVTIPLINENLQELSSGDRQLEFQVFHARPVGSDRKTTLIGSAFVDISALVIDTANESNLLSGYHYVFKRQTDSIYGSRQALGQVKITIRADNNIGECKRMSMQEGKLPSLSYSPTRKPAKMRPDTRFPRDDSVEFSLAENPFNKDATFGEGLFTKKMQADYDEHERMREAKHMRLSQDSIRAAIVEKDSRFDQHLDRELEEKSRDELLESHKRNMDDLDKLFRNLQQTLQGHGTNFGLDTAQTEIITNMQTLKALSDQIDQSLEIVHDVNASQEHSTFQRIPELNQTQKTDTQRMAMQQQLRPKIDANFNPFSSKIEFELGQHNESPHESDNEFDRD